MQGAFATVVFVVSAVGVVGAVVGLLLNRRTWDQYGKDHLLFDSEQRHVRPSSSAADVVERDEEVRQMREEIREMVIARNHRRARRGEPALDVRAEIERQIAELSL